MENEIWRAVFPPFHERYEVSNLGRVRRAWNQKLLRPTLSTLAGKPGYLKATLTVGETSKHISVHRLVATAFVAGDTSLDVNHKDMSKTNNHFTNLEWVTHAENIRHGMANNFGWKERLVAAARKRVRPVISLSTDGTETHYDSIGHAARTLGHQNKSANILHAIQCGFIRYGCTWRYA